jgi:hypothetical protein
MPTTAMAPQMHASVVRSAGLPAIKTVGLPAGNGLTVGTWAGGGMTQVCKSPATAAGWPPTSTVLTPGPVTVPPWFVVSPTRTADGTSASVS